jgi:hypothetical protein
MAADLSTLNDVLGYYLLPPPRRAEVNAETDREFFRRHPGAPKKLDRREASHRRLIQDWLRTRNAIMARGQASWVSLTLPLPSPAIVAGAGQAMPWTTAGALGDGQAVSTTLEQRFEQAFLRALALLPRDVADQILAMLTPSALAFMLGVLVAWAVSHFTGAGEIADLVLLALGWIALGGAALEAGEELYAFVHGVLNAKAEQDLDIAGAHFAKAVSIIGVQGVMAVLFWKAPKGFQENRVLFDDIGMPKKIPLKDIRAEAPRRPPGKWFYRPTVTEERGLGMSGETSWWGDITIWRALLPADKRITLLHERVHSILTPKLYFLRNIRVSLKMNAYLKSAFMTYLEEALAETIAQVGVNGFRAAVEGIKFPVSGGYVTLAEMGTEAKGILFGTLNVSGRVYHVFLEFGHYLGHEYHMRQ